MESLLQVKLQAVGYEKNKPVIENVNFQINRGELVGLIGPNGAGKSTTMQSILGYVEYMNGEINKSENLRISYIPETPLYYDDLTLREHIDFMLTVENQYQDQALKKVDELLKLFKMTDAQHQLPATFSKGMQQKGMIIIAMMTKPDLYIIDEPFIGLDPSATKRLITRLNQEKDRGAGILMSTHVLDTAEKICDRFLLIYDGTLYAKGTLQALQELTGSTELSLLDLFEEITTSEDI